MDEADFRSAIDLLERHYGRIDLDVYRCNWQGCVRFVLERQLSRTKFTQAWTELGESWLCDVQEVARCRREELWEFLQQYDCSASLVAFLHKLAVWWQEQIDLGQDPLESIDPTQFRPDSDDDTPPSTWSKDVARQDRSLANRVACVVFRSQHLPLTRGIWRIACRHQWTSWHDDPSETAEFFEQRLRSPAIDFAQLSEWLIQVGEDFCRTKPKCATCPLLSILGPDGPCELEVEGRFE
ncbi:MAG: nth 3 [Planctomycetaceae bacterium]|nr:nth 3 [Planctomycetaceae bacterium]